MKKLLYFFAVTIGFSILMTSCKKDDETTTTQKIQARWNFQKQINYENDMGVIYRDTITGSAGDYVEFKTDGKVYSSISGITATSNYEVLGNNKVVTWLIPSEKDTINIQTLTASQLILFGHYEDPGYVSESTIYFTK